ncbi:MAG: hypothetical protein CMB81_03705 [Flammeovirgaceae bacterium]|jgi:hypothetical protein|nr:hypothetical protein [Flammeovirgaceae bacterium]|tara:strand:+ start:4614 stop:5405 length:792 start_codon:yes stop_codon:yes gene_type:complete
MWFRYILLFFIFSCKELNLDSFDFTQHVDSHNLRIFGKSDVSPEFLDKVAQSYDAMFEINSKIDESMREDYLSTTKDKNVYQRVGLESSFQKNEGYADKGNVPSPYRHNCTDFIWEEKRGGERQINEVIEHLLHTVTAVILNLTYKNDWDYNNSSSRLRMAMQEAIDKGIYDVSSYDDMKGDKEGYNHVTTQEYAYWLVLAEWNYFEPTGNKKQGLSGNDEFKLGLPEEIASELPIGHQLYKDYVEKILSVPDKDLIVSLFPK